MKILSFYFLTILGVFYVESVAPCGNDSTYEWNLLFNPANKGSCSWLTKNLKKKAARIATWCTTAEIAAKCQLACGLCPTNAPVVTPVAAPVTAPVVAPVTIPVTAAPAANPPVAPTPCPTEITVAPDSTSYTFVDNNGKTRYCNYISQNESKAAIRRGTWCGVAAIKLNCPTACQVCETPTDCADNAAHTFLLENGKTANCLWFNKNKNESQNTSRKTKYCLREGEQCPVSCSICPT